MIQIRTRSDPTYFRKQLLNTWKLVKGWDGEERTREEQRAFGWVECVEVQKLKQTGSLGWLILPTSPLNPSGASDFLPSGYMSECCHFSSRPYLFPNHHHQP